ncbi:Unknown protein sequence [Pseudomonas syringae pv. cilantro]|uniref:Uncharacterized protein n=1 Tax=Pseudomonas syringae pv. cilantro TaxID=81035 RepID=A0A0N1JMI5_PSESX|nr:Unknown protein sequence [Pseudomonas syringae pv. cilantro]
MLALNAAIEAARAGEQARQSGFSGSSEIEPHMTFQWAVS